MKNIAILLLLLVFHSFGCYNPTNSRIDSSPGDAGNLDHNAVVEIELIIETYDKDTDQYVVASRIDQPTREQVRTTIASADWQDTLLRPMARIARQSGGSPQTILWIHRENEKPDVRFIRQSGTVPARIRRMSADVGETTKIVITTACIANIVSSTEGSTPVSPDEMLGVVLDIFDNQLSSEKQFTNQP